MTPSESISTWLVDWRLVNIIGDVLPPRDPNDDEEEEDEEDDDKEEDDEEDDDKEEEPPVIREPESDQ